MLKPLVIGFLLSVIISFAIIRFGDRMDEISIEKSIAVGIKSCKEYSEFFGRETKYSPQFGCAELIDGKWVKVKK